MKPDKKPHEKSQDPKETMRDLDQAGGGGLKAKEAEQVRGGKGSAKNAGGPPTAPK